MGISGVSGGSGMYQDHQMRLRILEGVLNMFFSNPTPGTAQDLKDVITKLLNKKNLSPTDRYDLNQMLKDVDKVMTLTQEIQKVEQEIKNNPHNPELMGELVNLLNQRENIEMGMLNMEQQMQL